MTQNSWKMTETMAHGYSSESTQYELSNENQHDRVKMVYKNLSILVLWIKVASALEGLKNCERTSKKKRLIFRTVRG